jgi:hypothetical protein
MSPASSGGCRAHDGRGSIAAIRSATHAYVPSADEDAEADPYWLDLGIFVVVSALGICLTYGPQIPRG